MSIKNQYPGEKAYSIRELKLIKGIKNAINSETLTSGRISKGELLRQAGYSKQTSARPISIIGKPKIQRAIAEVISRFELERDEALKEAGSKRKTASYRDLIYSTDIMGKNIAMLKGESTTRGSINELEAGLRQLIIINNPPQIAPENMPIEGEIIQ